MSGQYYSPFCIGYASLEEMVKAVPPMRTFYIIDIESQLTKSEPRLMECVVLITCPDPENVSVHYCRIKVGELAYIGGQPFEDKESRSRIIKRVKSAYEAICDWFSLSGRNFRMGSAVALPADVQMLSGDAECLAYDKAADIFTLRGGKDD